MIQIIDTLFFSNHDSSERLFAAMRMYWRTLCQHYMNNSVGPLP